jgi:hypothetical protein
MGAISTGCIAARVVFIGGQYRPGVLGQASIATIPNSIFRNGTFGIFGEFEDTDQPTVDFLSVSADTTQEVYFDLIQVRDGAA